MHSFHHSRGRILFDTLCALAVAASLAGAWMQTGASALLGAAGAATLYALVRLAEVRQPKPAEAAEPQRIDFEPEASDAVTPVVTVEEVAVESAEEIESTTPAPSRSGAGRRTGSRKSSGRRAKAPKEPKAVPAARAAEADVPWPMAEDPPVAEAAVPEEELAFAPDENSSQPHLAPLFEPDPFVRMQRPAFGRRGRL